MVDSRARGIGGNLSVQKILNKRLGSEYKKWLHMFNVPEPRGETLCLSSIMVPPKQATIPTNPGDWVPRE